MENTAAPQPDQPASAISSKRWRLATRVLVVIVALLLVYGAVTYLLIPALSKHYFKRHPSLDDIPGITETGDGHPGDPLNVALIGTEAEVMKIMAAAKWHPADRLTFDSCVKIAVTTVFKRPDDNAPVSNLYLFGRKQDLAFEMPVDNNPRQRHHVRFWQTEKKDPDGRPVWIGSATYDERVGLSHTTGQVTHHISGDVDAERAFLFQDLEKTGDLSETYFEDGFHKVLEGKNGGGDRWHTDGRLEVGVIKAKEPR